VEALICFQNLLKLPLLKHNHHNRQPLLKSHRQCRRHHGPRRILFLQRQKMSLVWFCPSVQFNQYGISNRCSVIMGIGKTVERKVHQNQPQMKTSKSFLRLQPTPQHYQNCAMNGKCTSHRMRFLMLSLSFLHTTNQIQGITHPILWKLSPKRTEIAIISKYNYGEMTLKQAYLNENGSKYSLPVASFCSLAIKIIQVLEHIHAKKVRHGNLRPDVISFWVEDDDTKVCIRDFSESAFLGERDKPAVSPAYDDMPLNISHDRACIYYLAPELFSATTVPGSPGPLLCLSQLIIVLTFTPSELYFTIYSMANLCLVNM
jgi:hypothetical protein